jgi:glucokinase
MVLNPSETIPCNCGKFGCVEQYCSATGIARLAREYLAVYADDSSLRTVANIAAKDVFDAAKSGDAAAKEILNKFYDYMGQFLGSLCSAVDPEVVLLGGGVSKAGQVLLDGVEESFHKYVFHAASGAKFALASLFNDAGAYGAFKLALDAFGK